MKVQGLKLFLASALTVGAAGLSACGGGGGSADAAGGVKSLTAANCEAVAGPLDPVQNAIAGNLLPGGTTFPLSSAIPGLLTAAVSQLLDTPDALAVGLQGLASSHDPAAFAAVLASGGDSLQCGLTDIEMALIELNKQASAAGSAVPGLSAALAQVRSVQEMLLAASSGDVSLTELADGVVMLQGLLNSVSAQLPPQFNNAGTRFALGAIGVATTHLALVLRELGDFDGAGVTAELGHTISALAATFTSSASGLPLGSLAPVAVALNTVSAQLIPQLNVIMVPLLNALKSVLQPQSGNPALMFQDILAGALAGTPLSGAFATLLGKLNGGGTTGGGLPIPVLGDLLDSLLGGLLGGLLG